MRYLLIAAIVTVAVNVFASQRDSYSTMIIWPEQTQAQVQAAPRPQPVLVASATAAKAQKEADHAAIARVFAAQHAEEQRAREIIQKVQYQQWVAEQKPIDPEKDMYRRYLADKERQQDPEYASPASQARDDFKTWKESQEAQQPTVVSSSSNKKPIQDISG